MRRTSRVISIYRRELISILRDRRTMVAMVVVPVVLYPALMLGFVRAMESDEASLRERQYIIEVNDEPTREHVEGMLGAARAAEPESSGPTPTFDVRVGDTPPEQLGEQVQLHVSLDAVERPAPFPPQLTVDVDYNEVSVESRTAMQELTRLLDRYGKVVTTSLLRSLLSDHPRVGSASAGDTSMVLEPLAVRTVSVTSEQQRGGWALGQIIPVILVLMTITGAVYPAIDLTAGERERGTLSALLSTPVPILHVVLAKFLVVATIALFAALINIASVGATMQFGGIMRIVAAELPVEFPASALPIIMLCMVPFALLSSAIMVAACSFARSFKEAQNYVMPIIILALVPAVAATLPSAKLDGIMLVMPVGNMVLLTRELFQQTCTASQVLVVLLSTTLYAAAAVVAAARLFGQEAVLFSDAGSYRTIFRRSLFKRTETPSPSQALLLAALLFPAAFYANTMLSDLSGQDFVWTLGWLAIVQFAGLFVLVPIVVAVYLKIDVTRTFRFSLPPVRGWFAGVLIGVSAWVIAREIMVLQSQIIPPSQALQQSLKQIAEQLAAVHPLKVVLLLGIVPAVAEEFLFRGFLLSGLGQGLRKASAIVAAAAIFGVFHFVLDRVPVTMVMGIALGYLCWQCRSIWPGVLAHMLHNSNLVLMGHAAERYPRFAEWFGMTDPEMSITSHLPMRVVLFGMIVFGAGLAITATTRNREERAR